MTLTRLREFCMAMPGATEQIQWGKDLVFKVGGKMFCVANTEPTGTEMAMSFKCDPATFAELSEQDGCHPAPYMARAQWIALEGFDTLPDRQIKNLLARAYELIKGKLPKKTLAALVTTKTTKTTKSTKSTKNTKNTKNTARRKVR